MIDRVIETICSLGSDVRYCLRGMAKRPWFIAVVVLTLAIGIGAACAIFSVVDAVLLQPLPYPEAERLVVVWERNLAEDQPLSFASFGTYQDLREQPQVFQEVGCLFRGQRFLVQEDGETVPLQFALVSPSLVPVLGVKPMLGRSFPPEELGDGRKQVMLSHDCWRSRFGGDPEIVGQAITMNDVEFDVIGIMPDGVELAPPVVIPGDVVPAQLDLWQPFYSVDRSNHGARIVTLIARLQPGVSMAQVEATLRQVAERNTREYPETNRGWELLAVPLSQELVREIRPQLLTLLGAAGLLLLIACVNVANLLLARGSERQSELAVRMALGAGRTRIVRLLLLESQLLAVLGGAAGLAVAGVATKLLLRLAPQQVPGLHEAGVDLTVVGFAVVVSMLAGWVSGLVPALRCLATDPWKQLRRGTTADRPGVSLRAALVTAEIALSLVLLVAAALLWQSFYRLRGVDPGFQHEKVLTMSINLPTSQYRIHERRSTAFRTLEERIRQLPQVEQVGFINGLPLSGYQFDGQQTLEGVDQRCQVAISPISPGYLPAMGVPLLQGRLFTESDWDKTASIAIVNRAFVRRYIRDGSALGMRLSDERDTRTIIGVVGDVRHSSLRSVPIPTMYYPDGSYITRCSLVVRSSSPLSAIESLVVEQIHQFDPRLPVWDIKPLTQVLDDSLLDLRLSTTLLVVFAGTALLLAVVGVFGIMSFVVSSRSFETGIRLAIGARPRDIFLLMLRRGMAMVLVGTALGLTASLALTRVLASQLFGVSASDPLTMALASLLLIGIALLACSLPARRATRTNPADALRSE